MWLVVVSFAHAMLSSCRDSTAPIIPRCQALSCSQDFHNPDPIPQIPQIPQIQQPRLCRMWDVSGHIKLPRPYKYSTRTRTVPPPPLHRVLVQGRGRVFDCCGFRSSAYQIQPQPRLFNHLKRRQPVPLDHLGHLDHLDHLDRLAHLDHLDRIDHLDHLDRLNHPAHLDHLDRTDHLDHLDRIDHLCRWTT
jgi:hypothetical protein